MYIEKWWAKLIFINYYFFLLRSEAEATEDQPPEQVPAAVTMETTPPTQEGVGDLLGDLLSLDLPSYNAAPAAPGKWAWPVID